MVQNVMCRLVLANGWFSAFPRLSPPMVTSQFVRRQTWKWSRTGPQGRLSGADRDPAAPVGKSRAEVTAARCPAPPGLCSLLLPFFLLSCHTKARHFPPNLSLNSRLVCLPEPPVFGSAGGRAGVGPDAGGGQAGLTRLACILFLTLTN